MTFNQLRCYKLNTGYNIPLLGLGTYSITGQDIVKTTINAALAAGYRHIDTAKIYENEREIGDALKV
jgi:diketogulonate reductase-like aldo/keto reductase